MNLAKQILYKTEIGGTECITDGTTKTLLIDGEPVLVVPIGSKIEWDGQNGVKAGGTFIPCDDSDDAQLLMITLRDFYAMASVEE